MCGCSSRTRRTRPSASASCFRIARSSSCARRPDDVRPHHAADANMDRPQGRASRHAGRRRRHRFRGHRRLQLLELLQRQAASVGVTPQYEQRAAEPPAEFDLIVGADGVNSTVRGWQDFGTTISHLTNKFAWYGTPSTFDTLTQTFVENQHGAFNAHHYRHSREMSTFVVECDAETWGRAGFVDGRARHARLPREAVWASPGVEQVCGAIFRTCAIDAGMWETRCSSATRCAPRISPSARARASPWRTPRARQGAR